MVLKLMAAAMHNIVNLVLKLVATLEVETLNLVLKSMAVVKLMLPGRAARRVRNYYHRYSSRTLYYNNQDTN